MLNKLSDEPSLKTKQNKGKIRWKTTSNNTFRLTVIFTRKCKTTVHIQNLHNITFSFHTVVILRMINKFIKNWFGAVFIFYEKQTKKNWIKSMAIDTFDNNLEIAVLSCPETIVI